ncbi:MAG TPA: hypothetical protein PK239_09600 [Chitinophagales bacterium]|mgnify:CR=1 FL=1|nr:hypothetical protein [Chitinophagales bacterium]
MIQLIIFLAVVGLISYGIGKLLNKNKSDEAALASGCGVLIAILFASVIGIYLYGRSEKNNPDITVERIKNDLVKETYYSGVITISQIKKIEIIDKIRNDDLLEVQIIGDLGQSDKFPIPSQKIAINYKFKWLGDSFAGWDFVGMLAIEE